METIIAAVIQAIIGPIADKVLEWHKDDNRTALSKEQITAELKKVAYQSATDWVRSSNDAVVKTFDSFQHTLQVSKTAARVWAFFLCSQIVFLIWLEMGVPALYKLGLISNWPVGTLDAWAMSAILACLGLGPLAIKASTPKI